MDELSALIPVIVVGGAVIYGVVKLLRSEAAGLRTRIAPAQMTDKRENPENPENRENPENPEKAQKDEKSPS